MFPLCELDQFLCLSNGGGKGLFNKNVLSIIERSFSQLKVCPYRRNNGYCLDLGRTEHFCRISANVNIRIRLMNSLTRRVAFITDRSNFTGRHALQVPDYIRSPVSIADYSELYI